MPPPRRRRLAAVPAGAAAGPPRRTIDYLPLDDVVAAARNPKGHDTEGIKASIRRFGFVEPIVMDERTGRLVAGHGRVEQLRALRGKAGKRGQRGLPDGVVADDDGTWRVPVVRGWASTSDPEAEAYLAASNRLAERGGWDEGALAELLRDLEQVDPELALVAGFTGGDVEALMTRLADATAATAGADHQPAGGGGSGSRRAPEDRDPISAPGDLYELGPHRLLCGDAANPDHLARLLDGRRAQLLWTDPPLVTDQPPRSRRGRDLAEAPGDVDLAAALLADALDALRTTKALTPGAAFYVTHPDGPRAAAWRALLDEAPFNVRHGLVWVADRAAAGFGDYIGRHLPVAYGHLDPDVADGNPLTDLEAALAALTDAGAPRAVIDDVARAQKILTALAAYPSRHTPLAYGYLDGAGRRGRGHSGWYGSNTETSVFNLPVPRSPLHPAMLPVDLVARTLANSTHRGHYVLDPFAGAGTTLFAGNTLGRTTLLLERDPRYVDVICRRWQHVTGHPPTIDGKPRPFPPLTEEEAAV